MAAPLQYEYHDTPIHNLNPATKLLLFGGFLLIGQIYLDPIAKLPIILLLLFIRWKTRLPFSLYKGFLIAGVFIVLIAIETPVLHYFISLKIPPVAWVVSALGLYGAVFILGDLNACRWRPIRVRAGNLELNTGLRWRCTIPLSEIEDVEATTLDIENKEGLLNAAVIGNQDLVIWLKSKHTATGIYGFEKEFDRVAVTADEPSRLAAALMPPDD